MQDLVCRDYSKHIHIYIHTQSPVHNRIYTDITKFNLHTTNRDCQENEPVINIGMNRQQENEPVTNAGMNRRHQHWYE